MLMQLVQDFHLGSVFLLDFGLLSVNKSNQMKFLEDICQGIVCPPKLRYSPYDLGSVITSHGRRHDFLLLNSRGLKLQVSYYQPSRHGPKKACVMYLHSMNGSRLESTVYAQYILQMGLSFCNFDFAGCGNSQGTSISFGANEKHDILCVMDGLQERYAVNRVVLWGRSMGAASAVKYCELVETFQVSSQQLVIGVILDSCYKSFDKLAVEIGNRHSELPEFLIKMGYLFIRGTLEEMGKFKVEELELEEIVGNLSVPMLFFTSNEDVTVHSHHSLSLFDRCTHSKKKLAYIKGLHNQSRDSNYLKEVKHFIEEVIIEAKGRKLSKFQGIASEKRSFRVEAQEWDAGDQCTCSLFPSPQRQGSLVEPLPTTRRRQSQPLLVKQDPPAGRWHFRSTQQLPQVTTFQLI